MLSVGTGYARQVLIAIMLLTSAGMALGDNPLILFPEHPQGRAAIRFDPPVRPPVSESAIPSLINSLDDDSWNVVEYAMSDLQRLGANAVEPLIAALKNPDLKVRNRAAEALGRIRDPRAIKPLIEALKDPDAGWTAGYYGLRFYGSDAFQPLVAALKDPSPEARMNAANTLGEMDDLRAAEPMIALLKDSDPGVRWIVASALGDLGSTKAIEPLAAALDDGDIYVQINAATALSKIGSEQSRNPLWSALEEGNLAAVAGAYEYFIAEGKPGTEDILVQAFKKHCHDSGMASCYLNSGNEKLAAAAREWEAYVKCDLSKSRCPTCLLWGIASSRFRSTPAR